VRYRRTLTTSASIFGEETTDVAVRFEDGKATLSRKDDAPQLHRREIPLADPIWILGDQCFEHWVLLGPYLRQIAPDGKANLFVPFAASIPTSNGVMPYTIRHERTEGEGNERRDRWQIEAHALKAKLWTDHRGRVIEYLQENSHILLTGEKEKSS